MSTFDVIFGVALVLGAAAVVGGIAIVAAGRVPGPPWLFGRAEAGDTARARLIGWQCVLQGMLPAAVGGINLLDGFDVAQAVLAVLLIASFVGTILINRRLNAPDRQRW